MKTLNGTKKRRLLKKLRLRDGDTCHLCGELMDFQTRDRTRSASIDHLKPRNQGGSNELDNLALAHRGCNEFRGSQPVSVARQWIRGLLEQTA